MRSRFIILIVLLSASAVSIYVSYRNALVVAERIFHPIRSEEEFDYITLSLGRQYPGADRLSIHWRIGYRPKNVFGNDAEVFVSICGNVLSTNPTDLRQRIGRVVKGDK
jgi:hypothetical protein